LTETFTSLLVHVLVVAELSSSGMSNPLAHQSSLWARTPWVSAVVLYRNHHHNRHCRTKWLRFYDDGTRKNFCWLPAI